MEGTRNSSMIRVGRPRYSTVARLKKQIQQDFPQMPHQVTDKLFLITADGIAPFD